MNNTNRRSQPRNPVAFEAEYEPLDAWFEVRAYPSESGLTVFFQDITDRKRHERRLERQARQFAGFGKILAHDLKNPLTVAVGWVEAAHDMNDISHLKTATSALDRLEDFIDDLANVLAEGALVSDIEPVSIAEAVNDAWAACETADATLVIDEQVTIAADEDALVRLFENLIGNTIEHAGQTATVRVGALPAGFYFEDDGAGIPTEERESVFEPGYTTKSSGSGLGLASVHQLVMAHGWNVTVTSSAAGGARFEFTDVEMTE